MPQLDTKPLTVSAAGAARVLGLGKQKTLALIHSGRLPAVKLDGRIRVRVSDIESFLASLPPVKSVTGDVTDAAVRS